uniref:Uncharacterized protein n=1 Tax=Rhodnius prolixus TaxID=13249 RepID=T1IEL1_RHOPR
MKIGDPARSAQFNQVAENQEDIQGSSCGGRIWMKTCKRSDIRQWTAWNSGQVRASLPEKKEKLVRVLDDIDIIVQCGSWLQTVVSPYGLNTLIFFNKKHPLLF